MKGLLLKDFYAIKKHYRSYFVIVLGFMLMSIWTGPQVFLVYYPFMLMCLIPVTLQNYDENSKWEVFCGTLPCTKAQQVSAKYLIGLILGILMIVLTLLFRGIAMLKDGAFSLQELTGLFASLMTAACILPALSLPLIFKYGVAKGRMAQYLTIGVVCGGAAVLSVRGGSVNMVPEGFQLGAVVIAIGLYALSWYLSVRFYEKREIR